MIKYLFLNFKLSNDFFGIKLYQTFINFEILLNKIEINTVKNGSYS